MDKLKSVTSLTTSTSTTTLSEKEPLKKLRPELITLLTCSIKQTRLIVKATYHIQISSTPIQNRDSSRVEDLLYFNGKIHQKPCIVKIRRFHSNWIPFTRRSMNEHSATSKDVTNYITDLPGSLPWQQPHPCRRINKLDLGSRIQPLKWIAIDLRRTMAQAMIELLKEKHPCRFCKKISKSSAGLMAHMNRIHPLDSPSGLVCYTCNKLFTNRDLIENHYKTVKHQLECKKMREMEQVEITNQEEETKKYRNNLLEITHFKAPEYRPRTWNDDKTKKIPLESEETLEDPRLNKWKMSTASLDTKKPTKKTRKSCEETKSSTNRSNPSTMKEAENQKTTEDPINIIEGIVLHVMESELDLFPDKPEESIDINSKEDCINVKEQRRVYLNNNWQVKDSIGSPAFQGIIEEDPNIDWLTFISININF